MNRRISKGDYVIAAIITVLVFSLGLTLGAVIDNARFRANELENRQQELEYKSLQFQSLYLAKIERDKSCPVLQAALQSSVTTLSESLDKVTAFQSNDPSNSEYKYLMRRYLIDNLRYWLIAAETKHLCGLNIVTVLYFYSNDCAQCPDQGVLLTHYKNVYGDRLLVFPIDVDVDDEPMIKILQGQYNLSQYPTIVVDDTKFEGMLPKDQLGVLLCREFKDC